MKICVIPALGGSKRIPKKNIKDFCGQPIIAYSIQAAQKTELFDHIVVSTDDDAIAKIARSYGAETPFRRPAEISDDHTGTNAVLKHAILWFQENGTPVNLACCIYATAPFVREDYLQLGHDKLIRSNKSFSFSVTSFPFPIQRALKITQDGELSAFYPEFNKTRSQDLEEAYHDAGQFYWGYTEAFLQERELFSNQSIPVLLPRHLVQDIDTLEDWIRAEYMYKAIYGNI
ncbi:MAG TPA: pseudaminic acid cytidylyltransferase [Chromatiaceae bacterium]|nr:pseudaminic acid cytidylyltransferase [Chromatiaceae bacterium]